MTPASERGRAGIAPAAQRQMVQGLMQALGQATLIETHISYVLLAGEHAYKIKKAVDLGFLDFTDVRHRHALCHEELRLNRRLAPSLYLDVLPVTGTPDAPALGGAGAPIDWALRMRRFAQDGLWNRLAAQGALQAEDVDALADALADFHARAAVVDADSSHGHAAAVRAPVRDTLDALVRVAVGPEARARLEALRGWEARAFDALQPDFERRRREGRVRECHGDLHLGNVARVDGRTLAFDCLEFDPALRWIDVMNDIGFLAMDLHAHALAPLAHRFVNACIERSGDVGGMRVLRYYAVYRALVRTKVGALPAASAASPDYLGVADALSRPGVPVLMITHGFSGSGKTWMTQSLLEMAGALRLRADVERKRLFGLAPLARSGGAQQVRLYGAQATEATYERLCEAAAVVLNAGHPVILDATFLAARQRQRARDVAAAMHARFVILDFRAAPQTLRARVQHRAARADDASDAGPEVLELQLRDAEPLAPFETVEVFAVDAEAAGDAATLAARWAPLLRQWVPA